MRLAIAADWLPTYGGAEHVVAALSALWPEAPILTTVASRASLPDSLQKADIRVSPLQRMYRLIGRHQVLLPWMPQAVENMNVSGYDVVLSSSHAVGKGVIPPGNAVHVCYCHTPMRYAWEMEAEYLKDFRIRGYLKKKVRAELKRIRRWDLTTAKRVDHFIANSSETQARIKRIYGRESVVVPPPVDAVFFDSPLPTTREGYFLAIGRLVPYKKFDLLIELANTLKLPLKIAGQGSEEARLRALAGPTVEFLGYVGEEALPSLYSNAAALFFPQVEDAGIVPMEAQACGTPVIAFGQGGIVDVVTDSTGILAISQTVESFSEAVQKFQTTAWNHEAIREHARAFHIDVFKERIRKEVELAYRQFVMKA
ncbi:MAG: glycosyltransferase [Candidatus Peribacteraceae bacterium]|nr:glycosyltransferase [Candidatus Peribacteraceae bacterium]MBP9850816.1 glycosyltransferase [Candidatus Peribacteraceae bacterium]